MKRVLIIEYMDKVRDQTYLALDNLGIDTYRFNCFSAEEGIDLIKQKTDIDLIICDFEGEYLNGLKLFKHFKKENISIPVLIYSDDKIEEMKVFDGFKDLNLKNTSTLTDTPQRKFEAIIASLLSTDVTFETSDYKENDFDRVRIVYFLRFNQSLCDVYLRLSENKYVKIINEDDPYTRSFIEKFTDKKVKFLYLKKDSYELFCVNVLKTPFLIFNKGEDQDMEEVCLSSVEVIHSLVDSVGISPMVIALVDEVADNIGDDLERTDGLNEMLAKMRNKRDYLYDHSYMVAYVACAICLEMEWDSDATRKKLTMAAMLHDVGIDDPDLALAVELGLPTLSDYSDLKIKLFKLHPSNNAKLIRESSRMPPNIDDIVENHHESPKMNGFPRGLNATSITKISGVFNVAHFFVNELYGCDFNPKEIPRILKKAEVDFDKGNYRSAVKGLLGTMKKYVKKKSN